MKMAKGQGWRSRALGLKWQYRFLSSSAHWHFCLEAKLERRAKQGRVGSHTCVWLAGKLSCCSFKNVVYHDSSCLYYLVPSIPEAQVFHMKRDMLTQLNDNQDLKGTVWKQRTTDSASSFWKIITQSRWSLLIHRTLRRRLLTGSQLQREREAREGFIWRGAGTLIDGGDAVTKVCLFLSMWFKIISKDLCFYGLFNSWPKKTTINYVVTSIEMDVPHWYWI